MQKEDSGMYLQIRNHAAAALSNLGERCLYGALWESALQTTYDAFVSLQNNEDGSNRSTNAGMPWPPTFSTSIVVLQNLPVSILS